MARALHTRTYVFPNTFNSIVRYATFVLVLCGCNEVHMQQAIDASTTDDANVAATLDASTFDATGADDAQVSPTFDARASNDAAITNGFDASSDDDAQALPLEDAQTPRGCPDGYVEVEDGQCAPTLIWLALSEGAVTPPLKSDVTQYTMHVGIAATSITLTPTIPRDATITIDVSAAVSNQPWTTTDIAIGSNALAIVVSKAGHPSRTYTLTVVRGGGTIRTSTDDGCDGTRDFCSSRTYDAEGHELRYSYDVGCDGVAEGGWIHTFDDRGRRETAARDDDGGGTADSNCIAYTHDEQNRLATYRQDQNCDGTPDLWCTNYSHDTHDGQRTYSEDDGCDGVVNHAGCYVESLDEAGRKTYTAQDDGCDGTDDRHCSSYTYDDAGRRLTVLNDDDCDGTPDRDCEQNVYDADGRQTFGSFGCDPFKLCMVYPITNDNSDAYQSDADCDHVGDGPIYRSCSTQSFD